LASKPETALPNETFVLDVGGDKSVFRVRFSIGDPTTALLTKKEVEEPPLNGP